MGNPEVFVAIDAALKFAQILTIVGGVGIVLFKLGRFSSGLEAKMKEQGKDLAEVKEETKKINTVLTELAVQNTRLDLMDQRYEEIRRVVFPLPGPR